MAEIDPRTLARLKGNLQEACEAATFLQEAIRDGADVTERQIELVDMLLRSMTRASSFLPRLLIPDQPSDDPVTRSIFGRADTVIGGFDGVALVLHGPGRFTGADGDAIPPNGDRVQPFPTRRLRTACPPHGGEVG